MTFGFRRRHDPRLNEASHALNGLDHKLERYLDLDGGFFLEAGANDGVTQSNTFYFERRRQWRGLLVEPVPPLAWRCRLFRPRSLTLNAALGSIEQSGSRLRMTYCDLMSTIDGAMLNDEEQQAHIQTGAALQKVRPYRLFVPCFSLNDILIRYQIGRIDLLSLDVEGYEENALRGIDFERFRPRYLLVEARYRAKVEDVISTYYEVVDELSDHDVLYKARVDFASPVSWGWRYIRDQRVGRVAALARWYSE
jgi:FkbM family methyltransferase